MRVFSVDGDGEGRLIGTKNRRKMATVGSMSRFHDPRMGIARSIKQALDPMQSPQPVLHTKVAPRPAESDVPIVVKARVMVRTAKALLLRVNGRKGWVPYSLIVSRKLLRTEPDGKTTIEEVTVPGWIAARNHWSA